MSMGERVNSITTGQRYDATYQELCFSIWYSSGRISPNKLVRMIPEEENTHAIPSVDTIRFWMSTSFWEDRADRLDEKVQEMTDRALVKVRMDMMKRHAQMAAETAETAFEYLQEHGFDSSASAVSALFKSMDAEKASRGLDTALSKIYTLNDDDLKKEMDRLLAKVTDVNLPTEDVVDAETSEYDGTEEESETDD